MKKTLMLVEIAFIGIIPTPPRFNQNRMCHVYIFRFCEATVFRYINRLYLKVVFFQIKFSFLSTIASFA